MKYAILLLGILLVAACTAPPQEAVRAQVNTDAVTGNVVAVGSQKIPASQVNFEFEGYGPGKSHIGTFEEGEAYFMVENGRIVGMEGIIQAASVKTDSAGLDGHLKTADFFDVEKYPTIEARSTNIDYENQQITGDLTFLGVTKEITFPATITDNSISADFVIDSTLWGMSYNGVNEEVRIAFDFAI